MADFVKEQIARFTRIANIMQRRIELGYFMTSESFTAASVDLACGYGSIGTAGGLALLVSRGILTQDGETFRVAKAKAKNV